MCVPNFGQYSALLILSQQQRESKLAEVHAARAGRLSLSSSGNYEAGSAPGSTIVQTESPTAVTPAPAPGPVEPVAEKA